MLASLVSAINDFMYGKLLIVMLMGGGAYYTLRTGFIQVRMLKETLRVILEKPEKDTGVSSFQALMVSTASRVGTGNIVGVASALCLGGFGAMFWMWIAAFLGGASAFIENTLAQIYKKRGEVSSYGGPAYYIESAFKNRFLAILFSFALIATYGFGFNLLCSFNLQSTFDSYAFYDESTTPWIIGGILALLASALVPMMDVFYIAVAVVVTLMNVNNLPDVFTRIFSEAFDFEAIFGGLAGSCLMLGIKRGLYSNEAGVGSAPNAAAAADVSHPVKQGLVQMFSVFIDTLLLCSATAFMCMSSGVETTKELAGAPYVQAALAATMGDWARIFITVSMILFAFTTLLGNLYYVDNCLAYIFGRLPGRTFMTCYRIIACIIIFVGAGSSMDLLWDISDFTMGLMALINLPVICILGRPALNALKDYRQQRREGKIPVFLAKHIGLKTKTNYWQG